MNRIGLDSKKAKKLAVHLNELLANYQILYMNTRGFHWNIQGEKFFELHVKFEELYTDLQLKIDEIAERILTLGHTPDHGYKQYLERTSIQPEINVSSGKEAVQSLLNAFQLIIAKQRAIMTKAGDMNDEGTSSLMSDYIREQEKLTWMYAAFLG